MDADRVAVFARDDFLRTMFFITPFPVVVLNLAGHSSLLNDVSISSLMASDIVRAQPQVCQWKRSNSHLCFSDNAEHSSLQSPPPLQERQVTLDHMEWMSLLDTAVKAVSADCRTVELRQPDTIQGDSRYRKPEVKIIRLYCRKRSVPMLIECPCCFVCSARF